MESIDRSPHAGRFAFDVGSGIWDWDDEVFRIHGLEPGTVDPSTELVVSCKHPEDRARVSDLLERVAREGGPFSASYRLLGQDGVERHIVIVGEGAIREPGDTATINGFYIDLTSDFIEEARKVAAKAVSASARHRALIEQAKGALMLAYGLNEDQAFAMLTWWSRNRNLKVREIAARLMELTSTGCASDHTLRAKFDAQIHDITSGQ